MLLCDNMKMQCLQASDYLNYMHAIGLCAFLLQVMDAVRG